MYCTHFGLHRPPFNNTPDPTFYLSTPEHEEALATLQYAVTQRKGFVLITGEVGAGKTLVGRMFLRQMDRNAAVAVITHTSLSGRQLLAAICAEFELPVPPEATNLQLAEQLQAFLLDQFAQDRFVVVLLDEGQNLPDDSFEELRMLGNLEADDAKLLQVCILGQPELRDRFRQPSLRQLDQRLFRRFHLCSLDRQTTEAYIRHRLAVAGYTGTDLFTPEALDAIYAASQGTPRIINQICDNALLTAYGQEAHQVDKDIITKVLEHDPVLHAPPPAPHDQQTIETAPALPANDTRVAPSGPNQVSRPAHLPVASREELDTLTEHVNHLKRQTENQLENFREDMRATLAQALDQYRTIQRQFENMSDNAAAAEDLDRIRKQHLSETRRIIAEITQQKEQFHQLLADANQRWTETQNQIAAHSDQPLPSERLAELEAEFDGRLHEVLEHLDLQRQQVANLAQILRDHCEKTRQDLEDARQNQIQHHERMTADAQTRFDDLRAALEARLLEQDKQLHALDEALATRVTAAHEAVEKLNARSATTAELETIRNEQTAALNQLVRQIGQQGDELAGLERQLAQQSDSDNHQRKAALDELRAALNEQDQRVRRLRHRLTERLQEAEKRLVALDEQCARKADLENLRTSQEARLHEVRDAQTSSIAKVREDQQAIAKILRTRQEADVETLRAALDARLREQEQRLQSLDHELAERIATTDKAISELGSNSARAKDLEAFRTEQTTALSKLLHRITDQADSLTDLQRQIAEQMTGLAGLQGQVTDQANGLTGLQRQIAEQTNGLTGLQGQVTDQANGLTNLQRQITEQAQASHKDRQAILDEFRTTLADQNLRVQHLRQRLIELLQAAEKRSAALSERFARKEDIEALRSAQQAAIANLRHDAETQQAAIANLRHDAETQQAVVANLRHDAETQRAAILDRLEGDRQTVRRLIGGVAQRFRATHQQIEELASTRATHEQLTTLDTREQADTQRVLALLDEYGQSMERQFAGVADQLHDAREEIETLTKTGARAEELERLEQQQTNDREKVLTTLAAQRRDLESLVDTVSQRCENLDRQLQALPADLATVPQLDAIRTEYTTQLQVVTNDLEARKAYLEQSIQKVARHCDQAHAAVKTLAQHAASSQEVKQLRQDQSQKLQDLRQRLSEQDSRHDQSVRLLAGHIRHHEERVARIETSERPRPVHIELSPQESSKLADAVTAARTEHEQLTDAVDRAGAIASHLSNASTEVQQAMNVWLQNANEVRQQSEQLRTSAQMASRILEAMRKCHATLDQKLNSKRWQTELTRGEQLAGRLEQATSEAKVVVERLQAALDDFEACEASAQEWAKNHQAARQTTDRLAKLLDAATKTSNQVDKSLGQRKQALAAVARNTSRLVSIIDAARKTDETQRPAAPPADAEDTPRPTRPTKQRIPAQVAPINWPAFRTHTAAEVG